MDSERLSNAVMGLVDLVEKLRGPGGCPWDAKQTDATIKLYLLEEAYEVLDAVEKTSPPDVCQELGDLLFHVLFLARLAEERKEFDFAEVVEKITEKMIRRHPHVFGRTTVNGAEEVADNWAKIKQEEKRANNDTSSLLDGVPVNLPSLLRAHRLGERASKAGHRTPNAHDAWERCLEEFGELKETVAVSDKERLGQTIGAVLFCLADLARLWGLNSEQLLRDANREFLNRTHG